MRYILLILALLGAVASSLALREHYRPYGESVCDINDHWDCGIVNHSPFAVFPFSQPHGIPVADVGIAGYFLLGILALRRMYKIMLGLAVPGLAFSLYLAHIEKDVLGVWCLYCAISLGVITVIVLLLFIAQFIRRSEV